MGYTSLMSSGGSQDVTERWKMMTIAMRVAVVVIVVVVMDIRPGGGWDGNAAAATARRQAARGDGASRTKGAHDDDGVGECAFLEDASRRLSCL